MSEFSRLSATANAALFRVGGEPIYYISKQFGTLEALALLVPRTGQSAAPGFFSDVEVDPLVITAPEKGDEVVWADNAVYTVARVSRPSADANFILSLHRRLAG